MLLSIEEEGGGCGGEKGSVWCVVGEDYVGVMELHVAGSEVGGAAVGFGLGVLTGSDAEEYGDLNEVGSALGFGGVI